jgi:hypothetical protein
MSDPQWGHPVPPPPPDAPTSFPPPPPVGASPIAPATRGVGSSAWPLLAVASLVLLVMGLSIPEDGYVGWRVGAWAAFAVVSCLVLFVPLFGSAFNLTPDRAWRVAAAGATGLFMFWVLLVVPVISRNTSFLLTASMAAAVGAAWLAPGRPEPSR